MTTITQRIDKAMANFYSGSWLFGDKTLDDALKILRKIEDDLVAVYRGHADREGDYRLGGETYGYDGSEEGLFYNLMYISDRWGGAFRIAWLLGLIDPKYRISIP